jgi:hypothetical protein
MDSHTRSREAVLWCDQSPQNLIHLDTLAEVFPEGRFLCLYRNCLDVVFSCHEYIRLGHYSGLANEARARGAGHGSLHPALMEIWLERSSKIRDFERELGPRSLGLRYEDLVTSPEELLPEVFSFLGLDWQEQVLVDAFSHRHDDASGDVKLHFTTSVQRRIGKGDKVPLDEVSEDLLQRVNTALLDLDYPAINTANDSQVKDHFGVGSPGEERVRDLETLFGDHLPGVLRRNRDQLVAVGKTVKIAVESSGGARAWVIDLRAPEPSVRAGDGPADLTLTTDEDLLLAIFNHRVEPIRAWASGRIHIEGDRSVLPFTKWIIG